MPPRAVAASIRAFHKLRILVVGDLFLDEYVEGEMFEISREGPIPVVRVESRTQTPGAAGNLASSLRNLGARVSVVGATGRDPNGKVLLGCLRRWGVRTGGVIIDPGSPTLTYSKLRARVESSPSREILRVDVLPRGPMEPRLEKAVLSAIQRASAGAHGIIVLDQIHHLVSRRVLRELPRIARARGALLHGSSREHIADFRGFDLITPNDREAMEAVGASTARPERLARDLRSAGKHRKILLTLGERGMIALDGRGDVKRFPTYAHTVADVTGAGDAVSSVALLGNILRWDIATIAWTASQAAAIPTVEHVGRTTSRRASWSPAFINTSNASLNLTRLQVPI
jgi:D-beta-D-heptose 7-phosphate kinase/D-beta-D-heptose 1-phosphate adenosyltransferase